MKILYISRKFYPEFLGGGQISGFYIAKALSDIGNSSIVCTFTDSEKSLEQSIGGVKIFRLPITRLKKLKRFSNMDYMYLQMMQLSSKIIKKVNPDVIHLLNFESIPLSSIYLKRRFNIPLVATVNGPLFSCFTQEGIDYNKKTCITCRILKRYFCSNKKWGKIRGHAYYLYSLWYMMLLKISYKYVNNFFAVSNSMTPVLKNMGVPSKKISIIHNPINEKRKEKTDLKKRLGITSKKVILYAGRLSKEKGIQHTIRALKHIKDSVFLIIGEKRDYYSELVKLVHKLRLDKKVRFVGYVENNKLGEFYSISNVVSFPCNLYESLSRMLLESLAFGVPIVASNIAGNKDIIIQGKNGYLLDKVDPLSLSNAINKILKNPQLENKMVSECRKKICEFIPETIGLKLLEEYKRVKIDKP